MTDQQTSVPEIEEVRPVTNRHILLAPGRARIPGDILQASIAPFESWREVECADAECRDALRSLVGSAQAEIVVVPGAASLGIEVAVVAASPPGAVVLVLGHGPQGEHVAYVVSRRGRIADVLRAGEDGRVDLQALRARLLETRPSTVVVSHVDAESGIVALIDDYAAVISEVAPQTLLVVDGTWATGCMPQCMDDWHADLVFTDSASVLGGCSGLVLGAVSSRLSMRRVRRDAAMPLYIELARWSSPAGAEVPANLIFALRAALQHIQAEGLLARFQRCEDTARAFREEATSHGFGVFAPPGREAPTLTALRAPLGVDTAKVHAELALRGVETGVGPTGLIVAHPGGVDPDDLRYFWRVVEELEPSGEQHPEIS